MGCEHRLRLRLASVASAAVCLAALTTSMSPASAAPVFGTGTIAGAAALGMGAVDGTGGLEPNASSMASATVTGASAQAISRLSDGSLRTFAASDRAADISASSGALARISDQISISATGASIVNPLSIAIKFEVRGMFNIPPSIVPWNTADARFEAFVAAPVGSSGLPESWTGPLYNGQFGIGFTSADVLASDGIDPGIGNGIVGTFATEAGSAPGVSEAFWTTTGGLVGNLVDWQSILFLSVVEENIDLIIDISMRSGAGGGRADFFNTATIRLDLPTGVVFTSASGTFLTEIVAGDGGPIAVLEPASIALFLWGLLGLVAMRRFRASQAPARNWCGWRLAGFFRT